METHYAAPLLNAISDYDIKLVQRLLYYTTTDFWLSDEYNNLHYPLLITIRDKTTRNWRERKPETLAARKARKQGQGKRNFCNLLPLFMKDLLHRDGAEVHGLQEGPGRQRLTPGRHRHGAGPKAQHQSRVSVLPMLLLRCSQ